MLRECQNLSVCVGRNFNTIDNEGVAGVDKGNGNHAVMTGRALKKSKKWGWLILMRNSWSTKWGVNGYCWLCEAHIESASYFECFSGRAIIDDPLGLNPPIAKMLANLPSRVYSPPKYT